MWSQTKQLWEKCLPFLSHIQQAGTHFLWPERCWVCREYILPEDECICQSCWQGLSMAISGDYCRRCGRDVSVYGMIQGRCGYCQGLRFEHDSIVRVGCYESTLRSMLLSMKFSEKTEWAESLALMLRQAVTSVNLAKQIHLLVPVPLHWKRKLKRGFNQSYLLAQKLKFSGIPISTDLVRIRHTQQQWDLSKAERRRNVKGAFAVRKGHPFEGKTVALVDDITTSGATLAECAKTLKAAGAQKVISLVIAAAYHDD